MVRGFLIYGLWCPKKNEIRYVGQSQTGLRRPRQHFRAAQFERFKRWHVYLWLRSLLREGYDLYQDVKIVILEEGIETIEELNIAEETWVGTYRVAGNDLTNMTDGGGGFR